MEEPKLNTLFPDTRWSIVVKAQGVDGTQAHRALGELCQSYWYPLYAYARRTGQSRHDAEDRVQAFLQNVIANQSLESVDPSRGKLRAFLKAAMRNFMKSEWRRDVAQKRGGTADHIPIDVDWAESLLVADEEPQAAFDRSWAYSVLRRAFERLDEHFDRQNKRELYEAIKGCLQGDGKIEPGEVIAERFCISKEGVRSAVFKLRRRFRDYIHEEIRDTCADEADAKEEIADLCRILTNVG